MMQLKYIVFTLLLNIIANIDAIAKRDHNDYTKRPHRLVCYFGSWAHYHENEPFEIEDIDYDLCTHVNYGFAKLNEWQYFIEYFDKFQDTSIDTWDKKGYERFVGLRKKNLNLTAMIALGGWWEGSEKYSDMAKDTVRRKSFVDSVVTFLLKYDFDGLDMDWEYPANRGGVSSDRERFIELLTELKIAFEPHGFLLTAALSPGKPTIETAYLLPKVNELVDWANVMTYDYHGGWENNLGHNAPLYARPDETDETHRTYNINFTVHYYLKHGLDKRKFVMGIPFYGRGWTLMDDKHVALNDIAKGMSGKGFISRENGILGYNEICALVEEDPNNWIEHHDPWYRAPYLYNKTIWIGFETKDSIMCKVSFLKSMGLSGGMVWSLENDDFKNRCGGGKNPLLTTVHNMLNGAKKDSFECLLDDVPETTSTIRPNTLPHTISQRQSTTHKVTTPAPTTVAVTTRQTEGPVTTTIGETEAPAPTTVAPTTKEAEQSTTVAITTVKGENTITQTDTPTQAIDTATEHIGDHTIHCEKQGYQPHPTDPHQFIYCEYVASTGTWWIHVMQCGPGTRWHQPTQNCIADYP